MLSILALMVFVLFMGLILYVAYVAGDAFETANDCGRIIDGINQDRIEHGERMRKIWKKDDR